MGKFVRVAGVGDLRPGDAKQVQAAGQEVALFNVDGEYHAVAATCTHRGGPLAEGTLEREQVTCPWHGAVFNVTSGAVVAGPAGEAIGQYPVRVVGDDVEIEV